MLKFLRIAALPAALALAAPAFAQSPPSETNESAGFSGERLARLPEALRREVEKGRIPGAVVLVVRDGKIALFEAVGFRDVMSPEKGLPHWMMTRWMVYAALR